MKKAIVAIIVLVLLVGFALVANKLCIGMPLDGYNKVLVYYNGFNIAQSHGKHYHTNGYYFGHKWQCVEFVKRYYYVRLNHSMPDGWGHAKDFFDTTLAHGAFNTRRGLYQYVNGWKEDPKPDDLLVFNDGKYGHVAIITEVGEDYVEIIQQNVFLKSRKRVPISGGKIGNGPRAPAGWLRLKR